MRYEISTTDRYGRILSDLYTGPSRKRAFAIAGRALERAQDSNERRIAGVRTLIHATGRRTTILHEVVRS